MSTLSQTYRDIARPLRRTSNSFHASEHPTASIFGVVCAGLALVTFIAFLPDLIRYLKISRM